MKLWKLFLLSVVWSFGLFLIIRNRVKLYIPRDEVLLKDEPDEDYPSGVDKTPSAIKFSNRLPTFLYKPRFQFIFFRPVNTPLTPLVSEYVDIDIGISELPNQKIYNPRFLSKIEDQGYCASCWALIVADMLANLVMVNTEGDFQHNLSAQQLLQCYDPKNGCDGNIPEEVFIWMDNTRFVLTTEDRIPYQQYISSDIPEKCPTVTKGVTVLPDSVKSITKFIEEFDYDETTLKSNILNMKKELYTQGPFFASMAVYSDFFNFNGNSVYRPSKNATIEGGHAILIVGYCDKGVDTRKGFEDGYWLCKNVWGTTWPRNAYKVTPGYFCILMGENICGIESRCGIVMPNLPEFKQDMEKITFSSIQEYQKYVNEN